MTKTFKQISEEAGLTNEATVPDGIASQCSVMWKAMGFPNPVSIAGTKVNLRDNGNLDGVIGQAYAQGSVVNNTSADTWEYTISVSLSFFDAPQQFVNKSYRWTFDAKGRLKTKPINFNI